MVLPALVGVGYLLLSPLLFAKPDAKEAARPAAKTSSADQLPIGQVVLFSSGVGYFQREGTVEGNARVDLSFPVQDINDLLKSMVVRDLDGGVISTVSYDSNAPVEKTLKIFAINLNGNPTFGAHPQPGARREGRGRLAADQRDAARHADRHRRRHREAEAARRQGRDGRTSSC